MPIRPYTGKVAKGPQMGPRPKGDVGFTPDPMETGEPTFMQSMFEPGLQAPKDFIFSTAASLAAPPLAIAKIAAQAPKVATALKYSPQITAAGVGGGTGRATQDPGFADKEVSELMAEFQTGFKDFAMAEAGGLAIGGAIGKGLEKAFPGIEKQAQRAINYARDRNIPIPSGALKSKGAPGVSKPLQGVSQQTFLGDFVRKTQASKINEFIDLETRRLAPSKRTIDSTATETAGFIKNIFTGAEAAKNQAYDAMKAAIPPGLTVQADQTIFAARRAYQSLINKGAQKTKFGKDLKNMLESETMVRTFDDLDQVRKTAVSASRKREQNEAAKIFIDGLDIDLKKVGDAAGFDLLAEKAKADELFGKLKGLQKIPGLQKFSDFKNAQGYIKSFVNESNIQALDFLKARSPEMYDQLLSARLDQIFKEHSKQGFLDGVKLKQFYDDNQKFIRRVYGKQKAQAIENFAKYSSFVTDELKALDKDSPLTRLVRFSASGVGGGVGGVAPLAITEGSSAYITSKLLDPNSAMFKIFTESTPEGINQAMTFGLPKAFRLAATEDEQ